MKPLLLILTLISTNCFSQINKDSLARVVITDKKVKGGVTHVWMKDVDTKIKYYTECICEFPYRKKDTVWIDKRKLVAKPNY